MLSLKSLAMALPSMPRLPLSSLSRLPLSTHLSSTSPLSTSAPLAAANLQKQKSGSKVSLCAKADLECLFGRPPSITN